MKSNYAACIAFVLRQEGGKSDTPGDRGGRTAYGITHATYDSYRTSKGLSTQDVWLITQPEVDDIYRTRYWNAIDGDNLAIGVDLVVFDAAVNSGPKEALWFLGEAKGLNQQDTIRKVCAERLTFMQRLTSWGQFGRGWSKRVSEVESTALNMATTPPVVVPPHIAAPPTAAGAIVTWIIGYIGAYLHGPSAQTTELIAIGCVLALINIIITSHKKVVTPTAVPVPTPLDIFLEKRALRVAAQAAEAEARRNLQVYFDKQKSALEEAESVGLDLPNTTTEIKS